ncbi:MAG: hypothetical protein DDT32_00316 [Syntrophomonadaceae bacterium]|nr:hypothetical protein [Bacillota bacterium]
MIKLLLSTIGWRYLNSAAYSTSVGIRVSSSIICSPINPACQEVPQPMMIILFIDLICLLVSPIASPKYTPVPLCEILPLIVSSKATGCWKISFSIKCGYPPFSAASLSQGIFTTFVRTDFPSSVFTFIPLRLIVAISLSPK